MSMVWRDQFLAERKRWLRKPVREPLTNAEVRISRADDPRWALTTYTDTDGWAEAPLPAGEYDVACCGQSIRYTHPAQTSVTQK